VTENVGSVAAVVRPQAWFRVKNASIERLAFLATVLFAGATFWFAPRPPMTDLAQHAGQIALWRDLLMGTSKWESLVYINYFTPYLLGYGLALLASFVLPVAAALKVVLALAYYGFVAACVALRRQLGGDRRLDWLFVPAFFGYAYAWGFYTFLVAAPFGVLLIVVAHRYAERPTVVRGAVLLLCDLTLFFAHGLVFLFANIIGGAFLLLKGRRLAQLLPALLPYAAVGLWCTVYTLVRLRVETSSVGDPFDVNWAWDLTRLNFPLFAMTWPVGFYRSDLSFGLLAVLLLATPLMLGARLNRQDATVFVPFAVTICVWLVVPDGWMNSWSLYQRFALFLLPFYALLFRPPASPRRGIVRQALLPLICWSFLAIHTQWLLAFADESAAFDDVLAATEPGHRALSLVFEPVGTATLNAGAYWHFPLWYQAEKGGFVDYNGAGWVGPVVRFRPDRVPAAFVVGARFEWRHPRYFDWMRDHAGIYRYFFVRHEGPLPQGYFPSGQCAPRLLKSAGEWSVYENVNCQEAPSG
jgi:hypothetical protein